MVGRYLHDDWAPVAGIQPHTDRYTPNVGVVSTTDALVLADCRLTTAMMANSEAHRYLQHDVLV